MVSPVSAVPAAPSDQAATRFGSAFEYETDCRDVFESISQDRQDFVLLDARSPDLYAKGHVPGAINLPHAKIVEAKLRAYPSDTLFVVYCAGPHCNGAHRAALRLQWRASRRPAPGQAGAAGQADDRRRDGLARRRTRTGRHVLRLSGNRPCAPRAAGTGHRPSAGSDRARCAAPSRIPCVAPG